MSHCPRGAASRGHWWDSTPGLSAPSSLSQAGREAGQASKHTRPAAWETGTGRRLEQVQGRQSRGPDHPEARPSAASPAHHAYSVDGIPLSHGPHAQGQDGEVGPGIGAPEQEAAPVGRWIQVRLARDCPMGAPPTQGLRDPLRRGHSRPGLLRPSWEPGTSTNPTGSASQMDPFGPKPPSSPARMHQPTCHRSACFHSCPLRAIL